MPNASIRDLNHLLGNIDIYLLDQILKARFAKKGKILDAGCGDGRNLIYFVRHNYKVYGIDKNTDSIQMLKYLVKSINKTYPLDRFINGDIEKMPYKDHEFDAVISSAVMHFADDRTHFLSIVRETVRILKPNGILFARMATNVGIESQIKPFKDGKFILPDDSLRFLLTRELLDDVMSHFGFEFIEPFKIVVVENQRSMSTLVLRKTADFSTD